MSRALARGIVAGIMALIGCGAPGSAGSDRVARDAASAPRADAPAPDAPDPPDAPDLPGLADLQFVDREMSNTWLVNLVNIAPDDCAVVEQCVGAPGDRLLLRFDTVTANRGTGDVYLGAPPPDGESNDVFQWSACHMHHHYANYISYELSDARGVVLTGRKQAFCLEDGEQVQVGAVPRGYQCHNQGISSGWADVYSRYLPCQWIDVTDLPSGAYTLRATVNPLHALPESNYDNNVFTVPVAF